VIVPHKSGGPSNLRREGACYPATVVCCEDSASEVVQGESFGLVLVVHRADGWNHAMNRCNGVKHGLVAALFSDSAELQRSLLEDAQAGILKLNAATADANAEAPFGGWKASGIGPPEHGASDREFYTRTQALYEGVVRPLEPAR
jgi:alpha-ketoglutaric semialdehyde dehydrogenase